jgi:FecR-like protein
MKRTTTLLIIGGSAMLGALAFASPAPAQTPKAGVVTTLQGSATVARQSTPQPAPLRPRDDVFVQDRISTGEQSLARILLGGKAVVTVREHSQLTISETATTSTLDVTSGRIALVVDKSRIRPGESVQIRTPNAVAAIRGTVVITEVMPNPSGATSRFTLLTGIVDVYLVDGAGQRSGQPVTLKPLQAVGVVGSTPPGKPQGISRAEADAIASDYKVGLKQPPPGAHTEISQAQVSEAMRRAAALGGRDDTRGTDVAGNGADKNANKDGDSGGGNQVADRGIGGAGNLLGEGRDIGGREHGPGSRSGGGSTIGAGGGGPGGGDVGGDDLRTGGDIGRGDGGRGQGHRR